MLMMMKRLAQMQEPVQEQPVESPAEKVLRLALELPASRPQLESEAARLEGLLDSLQAPVSEQGGQLMAQLVEVMEGQLDGIYGLLDGDEEIASANVSVFEPPDPDAYLNDSTS